MAEKESGLEGGLERLVWRAGFGVSELESLVSKAWLEESVMRAWLREREREREREIIAMLYRKTIRRCFSQGFSQGFSCVSPVFLLF